jgi:hypothetical protein
MNEQDKKNTQITNDDYGNLLLSFLMGGAAMVGIWYFSSILLTLVKSLAA